MKVYIQNDHGEFQDEFYVCVESIAHNDIMRTQAIRDAIETKHSIFDDVREYEDYINDR